MKMYNVWQTDKNLEPVGVDEIKYSTSVRDLMKNLNITMIGSTNNGKSLTLSNGNRLYATLIK